MVLMHQETKMMTTRMVVIITKTVVKRCAHHLKQYVRNKLRRC